MMEENEYITLSIAKADDKRNVATVCYDYEDREGGWILVKIQWLRFLGTSSAEFKQMVMRNIGARLRYRQGMDMEEAFPGWRKSGYMVKDITNFDVSFEKFWNMYGKKVGNKNGVEKRWNRLSWEERVMAMGCVPRMRRYYEMKGLDLPYPETYINQRRWENEFDG